MPGKAQLYGWIFPGFLRNIQTDKKLIKLIKIKKIIDTIDFL